MGAQPPPPSAEPPSLSLDEVRHVARLARLAIDDAEAEQMRATLTDVLGYFARLRELDLRGVEPLTHPVALTNVLAADEPGPVLPNEALMEMAPETMPPFVKVPRVIE